LDSEALFALFFVALIEIVSNYLSLKTLKTRKSEGKFFNLKFKEINFQEFFT